MECLFKNIWVNSKLKFGREQKKMLYILMQNQWGKKNQQQGEKCDEHTIEYTTANVVKVKWLLKLSGLSSHSCVNMKYIFFHTFIKYYIACHDHCCWIINAIAVCCCLLVLFGVCVRVSVCICLRMSTTVRKTTIMRRVVG